MGACLHPHGVQANIQYPNPRNKDSKTESRRPPVVWACSHLNRYRYRYRYRYRCPNRLPSDRRSISRAQTFLLLSIPIPIAISISMHHPISKSKEGKVADLQTPSGTRGSVPAYWGLRASAGDMLSFSAAEAVRPPCGTRPGCKPDCVAAPLCGALFRIMRVRSPAFPVGVPTGGSEDEDANVLL